MSNDTHISEDTRRKIELIRRDEMDETKVDLFNAKLGDEGARLVGDATAVQVIHLEVNTIGAEGVRHLCDVVF